MAHHYLSDMSVDELDHFIRSNRESMQLSPADEIALQLRRQRRAFLTGRESPQVGSPKAQCTLHVLLLGEDTPAKFELAELLRGNDSHDLCLGDAESAWEEESKADVESVEMVSPRLEVIVPRVSEAAASLRGELCLMCDVIVLCFSVADAQALFHLRERWWQTEVAPAFAALEQDIHDTKGNRANTSRAQTNGTKVLWPATPVIVAGLDADARRGIGRQNNANNSTQLSSRTSLASKSNNNNSDSSGAILLDGVNGFQSTTVVSHEAALQLAREMGASKYMELAAASTRHANALIEQARHAAQTVSALLGSTNAASLAKCARYEALHRHLRAPRPVVSLDASGQRLRVVSVPGVTHFMIAGQGRMPVPPSGIIDLRDVRAEWDRTTHANEHPRALRLIARARCVFASAPLEIPLPSAVPPPAAHIDAAYRRLHLTSSPSPNDGVAGGRYLVRYTCDGAPPTAASPPFLGEVPLDHTAHTHAAPWTPWGAAAAPPRHIRLAAFDGDEMVSPIATCEVPLVLETPRIAYAARGSTFSLDAPPPGVEYRYTLDGTQPTPSASLYTGPVSFAPTHTRQIRVVAFPMVRFASREAVFHVPGFSLGRHEEESVDNAFHTTRAAMMREEQTARKLRLEWRKETIKERHEKENERPLSARRGTPTLRTQLRAARGRSQRRHSETESAANDSNHRRLQSARAITPRGRTASTPRHEGSKSKPRSQLKSRGDIMKATDGAFVLDKAEEKTTGVDNPVGARCSAVGNTILFEFPRPVSLSFITVATPGGGAGPAAYEVEAKHAHGTDFMTIGGGDLRDMSGVQTLKVLVSARLFPIDRVRCVFSGGTDAENGVFRVKDIKVHGKPFA